MYIGHVVSFTLVAVDFAGCWIHALLYAHQCQDVESLSHLSEAQPFHEETGEWSKFKRCYVTVSPSHTCCICTCMYMHARMSTMGKQTRHITQNLKARYSSGQNKIPTSEWKSHLTLPPVTHRMADRDSRSYKKINYLIERYVRYFVYKFLSHSSR